MEDGIIKSSSRGRNFTLGAELSETTGLFWDTQWFHDIVMFRYISISRRLQASQKVLHGYKRSFLVFLT